MSNGEGPVEVALARMKSPSLSLRGIRKMCLEAMVGGRGIASTVQMMTEKFSTRYKGQCLYAERDGCLVRRGSKEDKHSDIFGVLE